MRRIYKKPDITTIEIKYSDPLAASPQHPGYEEIPFEEGEEDNPA